MDARQESWNNRRFLRIGWWLIMLNPPIDWAAFHNKSQHDMTVVVLGWLFEVATIGCNWITEGELKKRGNLKWRHVGNAVLNSQTPNCFWLLKYMILTYAHKMIYTYVCIIVYMYNIYICSTLASNFGSVYTTYLLFFHHPWLNLFLCVKTYCIWWLHFCEMNIRLPPVSYTKRYLTFLTHIHLPYCTSWCLPPFSYKLVYDPQWHPITIDIVKLYSRC
jgi:hypothetical protein